MPFELFVNGGLMRGMGAHWRLFDSVFLREAKTAPRYRMHSIGDVHPGMYEVGEGGYAFPGEIYLVREETWPLIEAAEAELNLYRGRVILEDGRAVFGILYPRELAEGVHADISAYGGWRAYVRAKALAVWRGEPA